MKHKFFTLLLLALYSFSFSQNTCMINEKQKKMFCYGGQSQYRAWYSIYEKISKDSTTEKSFVVDASKYSKVVDSLTKAEFVPNAKKQNVGGCKVTVELIGFKFYRTDSIKAGGKVTVDSIRDARIKVTITSEKEKINKTRIYSNKYTPLTKAKLEEKLKKYKDFKLSKYGATEIYELELQFGKTFMLTPGSYFSQFESAEREFF